MTDKPDPKTRALIQMMAEYPLGPGQMLWLGPKSVAYITGDWRNAPWLIKGEPAPGGKMLPDKMILEESEWRPTTS